jgi:putative transposase
MADHPPKPHSPNLNAFAERFVKSVKTEGLEQFVLFGENSLRHVIREYLAHYHAERNHQGIENVVPFPDRRLEARNGTIIKAERLGGLLNFYHRQAPERGHQAMLVARRHSAAVEFAGLSPTDWMLV